MAGNGSDNFSFGEFDLMNTAASTASGAAMGTAVGGPGPGTIIGAAAGAAQGLFGGKGGGQSTTEQGLTLPPALMKKMLDGASKDLDMYNSNIKLIEDTVNTYTDRINLLEKGIEGTIPPEQILQDLTMNSAQLALNIGLEAKDLVANGFIDEDDVARIEELDKIRSDEFVDEAFEQDFKQQRDALEQQLLRDGRGQAEISQTLSLFDSQKAVERQQRGDILQQGSFNRALTVLQQQQNSRLNGFNMATGALNTQQGIINSARDGYNILGNMAGNKLDANAAMVAGQSTLMNQKQQLFQNLGQFKFDNGGSGGDGMGGFGSTLKAGALNTMAGSTVGVLQGAKKVFKSIF